MRQIVLVLLLAATGCFGGGYVPVLRYAVEPQVAVERLEPTSMAIGVRAIEPAQPYKQPMVYRGANYVLGNVAGAEWAELPRDVVTRVLTDALIASGRFKDVGNAADVRSPDCILTGELRRFDEVRSENPWVAECEVRLDLRSGLDRTSLWAATLTAREPLEGNDPAALAAAMSRAVGRVVQEAVAGITKVEHPKEE